MKVLDLQCTLGHVFEGWFGSEADFVEQHQKSLVHCPLCGDPAVSKKLSAPRLSLSGSREAPQSPSEKSAAPSDALQALVKKLVSETTDVGSDFAEEARKIHYGETESRGIRGTATVDETQALADEGIEVLALPLPMVPKERLQ
ncbi:DUF1178 family protein [Rhodoferax sp. AJA081-3]|uniref:DUF1178 family protein n=1 Tax=Rhodoferax sp. AJA081-3 TaxID=2752316 RepID=UPI001AE03046|nr:DUF1178 family protein [Rhodoferax sp. AJA081-3]QTN28309.1 DUF1178 family protein [Rhodoferax sp. AJA081-3]